MGIFSRKATVQQNVTPTDLEHCLRDHVDVGAYRWLPNSIPVKLAGPTFYQTELTTVASRYGLKSGRLAPCELVREPTNPHDKNAIAAKVDGLVIGHVPRADGSYFHRLFDFVGDENTRLVGQCTFVGWTTPEGQTLTLADCEIQVSGEVAP